MLQHLALNLARISLAILILSTNAVHAKPAPAIELQLTQLTEEQSAEPRGSELYLTVTHYSSLGHSGHTRIPSELQYWRQKDLAALTQVPLWRYQPQPNEHLEVVIALNEHDAPPFNPDDALGSIKLVLHPKGRKWKVMWAPTNYKDGTTGEQVEGAPDTFRFKSPHSAYVLGLKLTLPGDVQH